MEKFTQKWVILCLLDEIDEGSEFYYTDFPLHVTIAGVFACDKSGGEIAEGLAEVVRNMQKVEIVGEQQDMFGLEQDIPVMRVRKTPELMDLYAMVYTWLENEGVVYNSPEYQASGYVPHSTVQKTGSLAQGEKRVLTSISLVDLFPHNDGFQRKIVKTIVLH